MKLLKILGPITGGILFAVGLNASGMVDPNKVKGFLNISGSWDPALIFVLGGAVISNLLIYNLIIKKMKTPLFSKKFLLPVKDAVDKNLILGSIIFGIGWGISGLCPGPGVVNLVGLHEKSIAYILSLVAGVYFLRVIGKLGFIK